MFPQFKVRFSHLRHHSDISLPKYGVKLKHGYDISMPKYGVKLRHGYDISMWHAQIVPVRCAASYWLVYLRVVEIIFTVYTFSV